MQHVLFPGAAASVQAISAHCPVAIASGALREDIETILRSTQLVSIFTIIVAAGETSQGKPAPDPYARALALLASRHRTTVRPERSVAIEDSHWGLESARAAGLRTIAVTTSYEARDLGMSDLIVPDISHVTPELLDRVFRAEPAPAWRYETWTIASWTSLFAQHRAPTTASRRPRSSPLG